MCELFARAFLVLCVLVMGAARGAEPVCAPDSLRPVLASPRWESDGFHFRLEGASNATYLVEVSTNLRDWTVFSTNAGGTWIAMQPGRSQAYVRAVLDDPVYPLFNFAVRAEGVEFFPILWLDSYDSSDPRFSTNGEYDPVKAKDGGDLAFGLGREAENYLGNSKIKGQVFTVPDAVVTLGPDAKIGSTAWHLAGSTGIEPGWMTDNLRPTFMPEPVKAPFTTGAVPAPGVGEWRIYEHVLGSGDYVVNTLRGEVLVTGNARLLVHGSIQAKGILISSNASLQIFCAGAEAYLEGVVNMADISSFKYYGLASNVFVYFSPSRIYSRPLVLKGVIYAPNAFCAIDNAGGDAPELYGACIARYLRTYYTVIHFDEQLKRFCRP
jgi:hypothetical protein